MNIKALLIDDDYKACANLKIHISECCPDINIIGEAYNLKDAVKHIEEMQPNLIFLDMQMNGELGFDLFNLTDLSKCKVIIVSAFEDFALRAIKLSAIDYLLKPINSDNLLKAIEKVKDEFVKSDTKNNLNNLLAYINHSNESNSFHKVGIPTVFGSTFIEINNVIRCEAERNYTKIYLKKGPFIMSSKNLSEIHQLFPADVFIRVHHSHFININHIKEFHKGKQAFLIMDDEATVQISQNKKKDFLKILMQKKQQMNYL